MAPSASTGVFTDFYTGGGKRTPNNVDARNLLADAFLNRNASASIVPFSQKGLMHGAPAYAAGFGPSSSSMGDHGYHRRSRLRKRGYYSNSSEYSTPEKKKKKKRKYRLEEEDNLDNKDSDKNKNSIVHIN